MLNQLKNYKPLELIALVFLALSVIFILFYRLGDKPIQNWDEGYYAVMASDTGLHAVPMINGKPSLEKPPLGVWIEAVSMDLFGSTTFGLRLPAALFSLGSFIYLFLLGRKLGSFWIGFFSCLLLLVSPLFLFHDHMARSGDLDTMLMFTAIGTFYYYLCAWEKPKQLIWAGGMIGLGLMLRGSPLVIFSGIIFIHWLITKGWNRIPFVYWLWALLATSIIALPWHIYMTALYGMEFIKTYLFSGVVGRAFSVIDGHNGATNTSANPFNYYYEFIKINFGWLTLLTPIIPVWLLIKGFKNHKTYLLIAMWILITFIVIFFMKTKVYWYLMPILPAIYLGITLTVRDLYEKTKGGAVVAVIIIAIVAIQGFWSVKDNVFYPPTHSTIKSVAEHLTPKDVNSKLSVYVAQLEMGDGDLVPEAQWYFNRENQLNAQYVKPHQLHTDSNHPATVLADSGGIAELRNESKNVNIKFQVDNLYVAQVE